VAIQKFHVLNDCKLQLSISLQMISSGNKEKGQIILFWVIYSSITNNDKH